MPRTTQKSESYHGTADYFDARLGRRPSLAPDHLSRILYIPRHDDNTTHLPVYEATESYRQATRNAPIGSSLYITQLGMMQKPRGEGTCDNVAYLADINKATQSGFRVNLTRRALGCKARDVELWVADFGRTPPAGYPLTWNVTRTMSSSCDVASSTRIESDNVSMEMDSSFPIPPTIQANEAIDCPYFTITNTARGPSKPLELQWQIHPVSDGPLRYTLVQRSEESPEIVRAIYHHLGWGTSLALAYSEGILLSTEPARDEVMEPIVVASLLGMLAQLRKPDSKNALERTRSRIVHAAAGLHRLHKWLTG